MQRAKNTLRWLRGWGADAVRVATGLWLLNLRKSRFRWNRRCRRCPCQHPSDSGRAFATHCDAAAGWAKPGRLRLVCPALRITADGAVCSVHAEAVRPHWGRALLIVVSMLVLAAVGGATVAFVALRAVGNREVSWVDVAWPSRWDQVNRARSRAFFAGAMTAIGVGDYALARVSFQSAVECDPENYDSALVVAMLESFARHAAGVKTALQWMIAEHPEHAARTTVLFHDLMLAQGRVDLLADYALWMAGQDRAKAAVWIRSMLAALRPGAGVGGFAQARAAELRRLDPAARSLVAVEILIEQGRQDTARQALGRTDATGEPIYVLMAIERLVQLGDADAALVLTQAAAARIGNFQSQGLRYWMWSAQRDPVLARSCFAKLATTSRSALDIEWLEALLVRAPDQPSFRALDRRMRTMDDLADTTVAGMWVAAVSCREEAAAHYWAERLHSQSRIVLPAEFGFRFDSLSPAQPGTLPALLDQVALPREVVFALLAKARTPNR